jgi:hypothetical protein
VSRGERAAAAALACVGARFRLHGRVAASGLDCVGVAAIALEAGGCPVTVPTGYPLRGGDPARVAALLDPVLRRVRGGSGGGSGGGAPGDIVLVRPGPGQLHLLVRVAGGAVHADAGLGRVVMRPGPVGWPVVQAWEWR